jgi:hypothetical protein
MPRRVSKNRRRSANRLQGATALVPKLIARTRKVVGPYTKTLAAKESMLSGNKVTGFSVNFPIAETCSPTKVCANTCYFARDSTTWPAALKKQYRVYNTVKADPLEAAKRLAAEVQRRLKRGTISFVRWNGGGDLFPESVECLNAFARECPMIPVWVVTRTPELAASIEDFPNIFIHFSLDRHSLPRRSSFESLSPRSPNYFFSYQCDRGEQPSPEQLRGISVLFYHCYKPPEQLPKVAKGVVCPLNTEPDICGVCEWCRRCFDGSAVRHRQRIDRRLDR